MSVSRSLALPVALLALAFSGADGARAAVAEITTVAETSLIETFPTNNLGAEGYVTCGNIQNSWCGATNAPIYCRNRALYRFDIAATIPAGSRIRSIRFVLWVSGASQDEEAKPLDIDIHRMLVPWVQGAGTNRPGTYPGIIGRPALPGEPCWNYRSTPDLPWGLPGGAPGVDYRPQVSGSISGIGNVLNEIYSTEAASGPLLEDVQFWLDQPAANHGWLLKGSDENSSWTAKRLMTPEGVNTYPRLEIDFVPPPRLDPVALTNGQFTFAFDAEAGQSYLVQQVPALPGVWSNYLVVPAFAETTNVVVPDTNPPAPQRFFRVVAP